MKFYTKFLHDGNGYLGFSWSSFKWWVRWNFAAWCLRRWLRYEGMPKRITDFDEADRWWFESQKRHFKDKEL